MQHEVDDDDGRDDQKLSGGSVTRYRAAFFFNCYEHLMSTDH